MQKNARQALIRELIETTVIERQSDFVTQLAKQGHTVTQATISRDIKEMQLVKVPMANGHDRYALAQTRLLSPLDKLQRTFVTAYLHGEKQDQFVHLAMVPGTGPAVGDLIEQLQDERVFATMTDDNGVLIICRSAEGATSLLKELDEMVG